MEIIVLILVWLIATFSANERDFGFVVFLVFSSLGGIAWVWRSRLSKLNETIEKDAKQTEALRAELKTLTEELRLMKTRLEASAWPATEQAAAARVKISPEPSFRKPDAVPTSMPAQQPPKAVVP